MTLKTLAERFLDIESEDVNVPEATYDTIDTLLDSARRRINVSDEPHVILAEIHKILEDQGFQEGDDISWFSDALRTKKISCKDYCTLYMSIAQALGLPLQLVREPNHALVRWKNGKASFNWEVTTGQRDFEELVLKILADQGVNGSKPRRKKRWRVLAPKEAVSLAYNCRGGMRYERGNLAGAMQDFTEAINIFPSFAEAYNNRGNVKDEMGNLEGAISDYTRAIKLNPRLAESYHNRGNAKLKKGDYRGALKDWGTAIKKEPDYVNVYINRGDARAASSEFEDSEGFCQAPF